MKQKLVKIIGKANEVHNQKYDYSLIDDYKSNRVKYPIICHEKDEDDVEHEIFYQDFGHYINRKHGCPKCSGNAKRTLESTIEDARKVHDNKYDYSKAEYKGIHEKMCIICHEKDENGIEHGEFWQAPNDHLHGQGCPKCRYKRTWDTRGRLTVDDVKEQFIRVHRDEYDYSLFTEYKNNRTKIPVICKKHDIFYVTPNNHLRGRGCPLCKGSKSSEKQRLTIKEVVDRIRDVHGNRYIIPEDFSYINNQSKVKLICRKHGEFYQNPFNLWKGVGCPKCNHSKLESEISLFLEREGIVYEEQKKFPWLKYYRLDFYLPKYNVAIECQGKQHFEAVEQFGGEEQLKLQTEWDDEKKALCDANGVRVIYFTKGEFKNKNKDYKYKLISRKKELLNEIKKEGGE